MSLNLLLTAAERKMLCESLVIPDNYLDRIRLVGSTKGVDKRGRGSTKGVGSH